MFPNWALLLPIFGLFAYSSAQSRCNFICEADWQTRVEPTDGKTYGYKVFFKSGLNFFEAQRICRDNCAEVATIHSRDEYDFVFRTFRDLLNQCQTNASVCPIRDSNPDFNRILNSFWLGMHRIQQYTSICTGCAVDSEIVYINSDGTPYNFGTYNGTIGEHEDIGLPWVTATPNGGNTADRAVIEDCTQLLDSATGKWNDIPCHYQQAAVVCKRDCASYCQAQVPPLTTTEATTTIQSPGGGPGGPGQPGIPGQPGPNGPNGADATTSAPGGGDNPPGGVPGGPGQPGPNGQNGTDATTSAPGGGDSPPGGNGPNGTPGQNGTNGQPGQNGTSFTNSPGGGGNGDLTTTPEPTTIEPVTITSTMRAPLPPPAPRRRSSRSPGNTQGTTTTNPNIVS